MELIIIFFTTFVAVLLSSMSGGGSSMINLPVFLWLGLPFPLASNISKVNSTLWVVVAARNYLKGQKINWKLVIIYSFIGLIGTYFGVDFLLSIEKRTFEIIVGLLILGLVSYNYFKKDLGLSEHPIYSRGRQLLAYPFGFIIGFYEGFFGAGNGILFSMASFYTHGFDFIKALGHYYAISFSWCLFGSVLLIKAGYYDIPIMAVAMTGSLIGAYVGSRYARYKGNKFIKTAFTIIGAILGLKLLLGL